MSGSVKSLAEGLKDLGCKQGIVANWPSIPYVTPVDPYEKQEKTKIKVKLPDGTNYQIVPFRVGSIENYVNHVIAMIRLIQQKELGSSVEKVYAVVSDLKDKIGPLCKKLNMSKSRKEKESLAQQIKTAENEREKAKKVALVEIVTAYELFHIYFVGKACTQWDKVVQKMHMKDPWVAVNGSLNPGPRKKTWEFFWTASNSTSSQSSPVTPPSYSGTICSSISRSHNVLRCKPL